MSTKLNISNLDDLIDEYRSGRSLKQLSDKSGIARSTLMRNFRNRSVRIRGRSEAELLKWSNKSRAEIIRQCSAAWSAAKGRKISSREAERRASAREICPSRIGRHERELMRAINDRGLDATLQKAVGPYNLDLALAKPLIAVEVYACYPHSGRREHIAKRSKYLINRGWTVLNVLMFRGGGEVGTVGDYIASLAKKLRRNKSLRGQYLVIGSDAKPTTTACLDL